MDEVEGTVSPEPEMWAAMVADAKRVADWWPPAPAVGRAVDYEGELVYPIAPIDQLEAEVVHRLALLAPLVDAEDRQAVIMGLRQMDAQAAMRLCVALFPWGWPDQCGAGDWWLTGLGRLVARALVHVPEFNGPMPEVGATASSQWNVTRASIDRTRQIFSKGIKPRHRKPQHWPYQRARVLGRMVNQKRTAHIQAREARVTHRWLRHRLGLRPGPQPVT